MTGDGTERLRRKSITMAKRVTKKIKKKAEGEKEVSGKKIDLKSNVSRTANSDKTEKRNE